MNAKRALITGIAGQDGSYLAELLLDKGYEVSGVKKKESNTDRIAGILDKLNISDADICDRMAVAELIKKILPDEIYHLATKHDEPGASAENYSESGRTNIDSTFYLLAAIEEIKPKCRFFFASTSKIFGKVKSSPQNEETTVAPNSLYGVSKAAGMGLARMYRETKNVFACSGILYNHESPRRDPFFLPKKITSSAAKIKLGLGKKLLLGDIEARRDWGFAGDFAEAMYLILQAEKPEDYVIATGETHSVKEILDIAFGEVGLKWRDYVETDKSFVQPTEKFEMVGDISKIKRELSWKPKKSFSDLIKLMVAEDLKTASEN